MEVFKGYITSTKEGGRRAQVETLQGEVIDDVLLLYPHGFMSNIKTGESSLVLLVASMGSKTNMFGIPYDILKQPSLEETEVAVGNFTQGNKVTFKANGDIEIETSDATLKEVVDKLETTATTSITMTAPTIDLGDALGLVLNTLASMDVTIPGGSSAGTYPVNINSAGQTKVSA